MTRRPAWLAGAGTTPPATARAAPADDVRTLVLFRAGARCESCGEVLRPGRWSLHHRRPSGMGGTRASVAHSPSNLLALCGTDNVTGCHGLVHRNPAAARDAGLLVRKAADPTKVPVRLFDDRRVLLTTDGTYIEEDG